jgi:2-hydroxy-6-oxonona-2,4-dienedioate hydrolase
VAGAQPCRDDASARADPADRISGVGILHRSRTAIGIATVHAWVTLTAGSDAPAVVLVHGIGVSSRYMLPTAVRLAPACRVWVPDLPGFGRSGKPSHVLGVDELADALAAWMQAIGLPRATLVGNSFGCQIIAAVTVRHPATVERVVLQGPTMDPRARSVARQLARWALNSPLEPRTPPPSLGTIVRADYRDAGLRRVLATFRRALEDRIETRLPHLTASALVVRGARDPIVPQRWGEQAAALLPRGRLVVVPGAAHTMNYTSPDQLAAVVREFLGAQIPAPT